MWEWWELGSNHILRRLPVQLHRGLPGLLHQHHRARHGVHPRPRDLHHHLPHRYYLIILSSLHLNLAPGLWLSINWNEKWTCVYLSGNISKRRRVAWYLNLEFYANSWHISRQTQAFSKSPEEICKLLLLISSCFSGYVLSFLALCGSLTIYLSFRWMNNMSDVKLKFVKTHQNRLKILNLRDYFLLDFMHFL